MTLVDEIQRKTTELVDLCEQHKRVRGRRIWNEGEADRLWALAQTHYENAAMWAIKAATTE